MPLGIPQGNLDLQSPRIMLVEARAPKSLSNVRSHGPNLGLDVGGAPLQETKCFPE